MDDKIIKIKEVVRVISPPNPESVMQFIQYIKANTLYPVGETTEGQVVVGFKTHDSGTMTDIHIIQSLSEATDAEALRVVEAYGQWPPQETVEERAPISKHTVSINFTKEQI
ncbi:MAG: TonB family protein, partial [Mucilaginibacter sp.]|jgi:TonB family protein|nr:TonB family protein [Mucilaginibacter sp.]